MSMIIEVRVVPNARRQSVADWNGKLFVHLMSRAESNKANMELLTVLADHFGVRKSCVRLVRGSKTKDKIVEILK